MEKYEDLGSAGNSGAGSLMRSKETEELVSVKFIRRGCKVHDYVAMEIINHRTLNHPNVIRFKEVVLTPTHLAIVMEHAAGGELFDRVQGAGRFSEDEARFFFQQLMCGVSYCHFMLEKTLLDRRPVPRLKICDFGHSQSMLFCSRPKSELGFSAYIAPEDLSFGRLDAKVCICEILRGPSSHLVKQEEHPSISELESRMHELLEDYFRKKVVTEADKYMRRTKWFLRWFVKAEEHRPLTNLENWLHNLLKDHIPKLLTKAELADVWSCRVTLYAMLVGAYPFEEPDSKLNSPEAIDRILSAHYKIPDCVHISQDCRQLLDRIFVANPAERIAIQEIRKHPWFLKNLPQELTDTTQAVYFNTKDQNAPTYSLQSEEEIIQIVNEAKNSPSTATGGDDDDEEESDDDYEEEYDDNNEEDEEYEEEEEEEIM